MSNLIELYRVGPLPTEAQAISRNSNIPGWLRDSLQSSGSEEAMGRWFTSSKTAAEWYRREHPGWPMCSVTVTAMDAEVWKASNHPSAARFASEPNHEYFLPAKVADKAQPVRERKREPELDRER